MRVQAWGVMLVLLCLLSACGGSAADAGPSESVVKSALDNRMVLMELGKGTQRLDRFMTVQRGTPLVASGNRDVPDGTPLFPVKVRERGMAYEYVFYQDSFGEWKFDEM